MEKMEKHSKLPHSGSQPEKKTLYETYTDYIDPSTITVNHYMSQPFHPTLDPLLTQLTQFLSSPSTTPLILRTSPGIGTKTLLSHFHTLLQSASPSASLSPSVSSPLSASTAHSPLGQKYKILPILHFASISSNYFYCLYRIIIHLRQALKLKQSVYLLEQKIRKYFAYWIDLAGRELERQMVVFGNEELYEKIVIIIEGIDKFVDNQSGREVNVGFWLPQQWPKNVKIICTAGEGSEAIEYCERRGYQIIGIGVDKGLVQRLAGDAIEKETLHDRQIQVKLKEILKQRIQKMKGSSDVYKFIKGFSNFLLIQKDRTKSKDVADFFRETIKKKVLQGGLQKITRTSQLYDVILSMYGESLSFKKKITQILMYFALSQKGITIKQIIQLTRFTQQEWSLFYSIFSPIIIKYGSIYSIKCSTFIQSIVKKDRGPKQNKQAHLIKYHQKIAQALQNTPNSIRKLQEQTYHLFISKSYFKLKQIVSTIQNFLLMFNPNNKYELSRYWQKLEEKGFDPVIEYNKAIEGFSMHYHPSDENIFKIIVQISRFLKEFCDFQTYETPSFRHPLIEGNMIQLQKIGLLDQFTQLQIYVDNSFNQADQPQPLPQTSLQQQILQIRSQYFPLPSQSSQCSQSASSPSSPFSPSLSSDLACQTLDIPSSRQLKKIKKKLSTPILSQIEQLNIDVPMNRQKFRSHYLNTLKQFVKGDENNKQQDQGYFVVQDETNEEKRNYGRGEFNVNKIKENYKMRVIKPSLYYYKRWIWIQFPWVCISLNSNYSKAPEFCNFLECQDMDSYEQEAKYTKQALVVAIQAKEKKKMMFTKKSDDLSGFGTGFGSRFKNGNCTSMGKFSASRNIQRSTMRSRFQQKAFSNIDLNLNSLTKQLELRKKNMPNEYKIQNQTQGIFLSEINQNCQQDMKFINERKHFEAPDIQGLPSNEVLPKLKWTIKDHTNYEINYIKAHIEEKKKKLNKIIFQNKKLAQTYKQLKLKQNLTKKNIIEQQTDKHTRKTKLLQQYTQKKEDVINQFCKSLLQKERLKIILKLCAENKTRNEEYLASLNYFLQNLKKMITWEKNNIKEVTTQMNGIKVMKERKEIMEAERQRNAKIVEKQAKNYLEEKEKLEQQIENISVIIAQDLRDQKDKLQNSLQGHMKNREQKNILMQQQKKTKQLEQKLKSLQQQYESLKKLFQIDGTNFQSSPKFLHLLAQNEKNKKLKILYFQRKNHLQHLNSLPSPSTSSISQVNQKSSASGSAHPCPPFYNNSMDKNINKNATNLKIMLSNLALRIGVKDIQDIVPFLKGKITELREKDLNKYLQVVGGQ